MTTADQFGITVRDAVVSDVPHIQRLCEPFVQKRILLGKDLVTLYGDVQEFQIAVGPDGTPIGCGALHVMWDDLAEVRTLALDAAWIRRGVGHRLLEALEGAARRLEIGRLFCLTFEVDFFEKHGYLNVGDEGLVPPDVYGELVRSTDEGVAEFLDLARVKPNTLGNSRMLKALPPLSA
ncbi:MULTISPECIES: amino-acid N-acetyltransferase [unclassified Frigoribacterium]|uniref:amino-acid N-acetyltransferase n=1 Tax=unclassified Frigoribacterium TaxID=2627005 RepID=UPI0006FD56C9|nr:MULTISPECIES: amino-acid N-acetyltransferase [unclassified Frigoribacterium]KQO81589.1 N-acetylglutamate synthase [Frigoribacterium sp. Leaf263]KQR65899.1 N-acetylglutamate synthase [Frigoribacterium sp. Leaf172]